MINLTLRDAPTAPSGTTEFSYDGRYGAMCEITRTADDGIKTAVAIPFRHLHSLVGEYVRRSKIEKLMNRSLHDILESPFTP